MKTEYTKKKFVEVTEGVVYEQEKNLPFFSNYAWRRTEICAGSI